MSAQSDSNNNGASRRDLFRQAAGAVAAAAALTVSAATAGAQTIPAYADPAEPGLPASNMELIRGRVGLVVVDPQNDFLTEAGVAWGVVGESVREHNVVENIERLFIAAKAAGLPVVISPHYYYPTDHGWAFEGTLEKVMHSIKMFDRRGPTDISGFQGSGADFVERYKPYILDGKTVVASPHKLYGPEQNDVGLQLRKQRVDQVILAGMSSNLCVESHMREL
ncbi:MAG TPA: isochorismatase family protein, partial [Hyphomonas sp.]|nr:isochorismatase family protein [Hyphomonas sp.]